MGDGGSEVEGEREVMVRGERGADDGSTTSEGSSTLAKGEEAASCTILIWPRETSMVPTVAAVEASTDDASSTPATATATATATKGADTTPSFSSSIAPSGTPGWVPRILQG